MSTERAHTCPKCKQYMSVHKQYMSVSTWMVEECPCLQKRHRSFIGPFYDRYEAWSAARDVAEELLRQLDGIIIYDHSSLSVNVYCKNDPKMSCWWRVVGLETIAQPAVIIEPPAPFTGDREWNEDRITRLEKALGLK